MGQLLYIRSLNEAKFCRLQEASTMLPFLNQDQALTMAGHDRGIHHVPRTPRPQSSAWLSVRRSSLQIPNLPPPTPLSWSVYFGRIWGEDVSCSSFEIQHVYYFFLSSFKETLKWLLSRRLFDNGLHHLWSFSVETHYINSGSFFESNAASFKVPELLHFSSWIFC